MKELVGLSYSPWTDKARWALDHHGVRYRFTEYVPLVAELGLRRRIWRATKRLGGRVSVPVLFTEEGEVFTDSLSIARFADRVGQGGSLFPEGSLDAIETWHRRSELVLEAGRSLMVRAMRDSPDALRESAPPFVPRWLKPTVASVGVSYVSRKYGVPSRDPLEDERAIDLALEQLASALGGSPGPFVLGEAFTFADVAMAVSLCFVLPPDSRFLHVGRGLRHTMTRDLLAEKHRDLIEWRDRTYERRLTYGTPSVRGA